MKEKKNTLNNLHKKLYLRGNKYILRAYIVRGRGSINREIFM